MPSKHEAHSKPNPCVNTRQSKRQSRQTNLSHRPNACHEKQPNACHEKQRHVETYVIICEGMADKLKRTTHPGTSGDGGMLRRQWSTPSAASLSTPSAPSDPQRQVSLYHQSWFLYPVTFVLRCHGSLSLDHCRFFLRMAVRLSCLLTSICLASSHGHPFSLLWPLQKAEPCTCAVPHFFLALAVACLCDAHHVTTCT